MEFPKKIKVVIVINDFIIGGAQRMLADLMHHIDRSRFDISLITLFFWPEKTNFYDRVPADVPVHRLAFKGFWDMRGWMSLRRQLRLISPDIALSNLFFSNTVTRVLKPFFRYRVISVEHNTYSKKTRLHQYVDLVLSYIGTCIIAVSQTVAEFTARQEGIPLRKFTVIQNGVDVGMLRNECDRYDPSAVKKEFGISDGARIILNVARLTTQKNPLLLLEGFSLFARTHPMYVLVMIGGSEKWEKSLRAKATELGIGQQLFLAGTRTDVTRFYAMADYFVSTSSIEGFPIAHTEALACGVPVLSTKTAGADELIQEGVNGYFIIEHTPQAVAEGLEKITQADHAQLSAGARKSAERYSIERTAHAYEALFQRVAADGTVRV